MPMHRPIRDESNPAYDPFVGCEHTPDVTFTRQPCSCGRTFWPPRGRGRGESLLSPRRLNAKARAVEATRLRILGYRYPEIAWRLGYRCPSGAWRAVHRILDVMNQRDR